MLSTEAFNALLKTLEEPPPHVTFIFATTEAHKVPVTILSRCQRYDFKLVPTARLHAHLDPHLRRRGPHRRARGAVADRARVGRLGARRAVAERSGHLLRRHRDHHRGPRRRGPRRRRSRADPRPGRGPGRRRCRRRAGVGPTPPAVAASTRSSSPAPWSATCAISSSSRSRPATPELVDASDDERARALAAEAAAVPRARLTQMFDRMLARLRRPRQVDAAPPRPRSRPDRRRDARAARPARRSPRAPRRHGAPTRRRRRRRLGALRTAVQRLRRSAAARPRRSLRPAPPRAADRRVATSPDGPERGVGAESRRRRRRHGAGSGPGPGLGPGLGSGLGLGFGARPAPVSVSARSAPVSAGSGSAPASAAARHRPPVRGRRIPGTATAGRARRRHAPRSGAPSPPPRPSAALTAAMRWSAVLDTLEAGASSPSSATTSTPACSRSPTPPSSSASTPTTSSARWRVPREQVDVVKGVLRELSGTPINVSVRVLTAAETTATPARSNVEETRAQGR